MGWPVLLGGLSSLLLPLLVATRWHTFFNPPACPADTRNTCRKTSKKRSGEISSHIFKGKKNLAHPKKQYILHIKNGMSLEHIKIILSPFLSQSVLMTHDCFLPGLASIAGQGGDDVLVSRHRGRLQRCVKVAIHHGDQGLFESGVFRDQSVCSICRYLKVLIQY